MRWSTRVLLSSLAAVLIPLVVLTAVGVPSIIDHLSNATEAALQGSVRAVAALVATGLEDLRREARLLARDPAIVQGVVKSDWGVLARAASPRMLSLTLDRVADLILIVDERGAPLVRVPASAEAPAMSLAVGPADAIAAVRLVSGAPMLLAAAPVVHEGRAMGTVVVGSKLEGIAKRLGATAFPMELVFVAGGEPIYTTLAVGASDVRWGEATRAGRAEVNGTSYLLRTVGQWPEGSLWLLAPDAHVRATQGLLWTWVAGFVLFAASATFAATWILTRRVLRPIEALGAGARRMAGGDFEARVPVPLGREAEVGDVARAFNEMGVSLQRWRQEVEHRTRELEALGAVVLTVNRTIDLIPTAEETLGVMRRVAEMDVAALYQVEEGGAALSLVAQRGLSPELAERLRVRPVEGSQLGKAARTGRPTVAHGLSSGAAPDSTLGLLVEECGHQTQLALPILVKGEVWGVMALVASTRREFSADQMQLMEAVAYQVGVAVERASLFAESREKGQRLESVIGLAQTVTSSLDHREVLQAVVQAASGLIPGSSVRLWTAEEDRLVVRVESGTAGAALGGRTTLAIGEGLVGHVAQTREPLVVERVFEDPRTINVEWLRREGYVSYAGVPLLFQNRLLGVLAILMRRPHRPSKEELELLVSFATQAAISMENARLYAEASRSAAEHQALLEVGGLVGSTLKVERILDVIVDRVRALLGVRSAGIFKLDAAVGTLAYERGIGLSPEFIQSLRVRVGEGTSGKAIRYRAPAWSADILNDGAVSLSDEARALVTREGYRAVLSVPILIKNEPYGVLAVYWWEPHAPTFSEVRLLSALAGQAAVALENAELYEAATRRGKRLETLAELTRTLTATLSVEDVLSRIVKSAVELFGSSVSRLWLVDEDGETLSLRAHAGSLSDHLGRTRLRVGEGLMGWIVANRAPLVIPDLREDPRVRNRERIRLEGTVSFAGAPLLLGDRPLGALSIALREPHEFTEEEVSLLQSLANHAAIAFENARLFQAADRRAARMRTLAEMGRLLASTFDVDQILETVATRCRESLELSDLGIYLLDGAGPELRFAWGFGFPARFSRHRPIQIGEGVAGRAIAERRPIETADFLSDPEIALDPEARAQLGPLGSRAVLAIPLSSERPFGALSVYRAPGHRFSEEEKEFLVTFGNQVAVALENARLFALEQSRRAQVEALVEIERELAAELNPDRLLDLIIQRAGALLKARGVVFLLDEASGLLAPKAWYAMPPQIRDLRIPLGVGMAGTAAVERRGLLANDFSSAPYAASLAQHGIPLLGIHHAMAQPLVAHDRLLGVIAVNREEGNARFTEGDLETFGGFATQAAIALENARLYREAREHAERLEALDAVNRLVSSSLQVEEVLRNIAQAASAFFEAPQAHVWVVAPGDQRLRRSVTVGDSEVAAGLVDDMAFGEGGVGWVAQRREPIVWADLEQDTRVLRRTWALRHGLRYYTAYPIMLGDRLLGAITMHRRSPYPVNPETQGLLGSLVAQAAVALDNARLYAETRRRLEETQALLEVSEILSSTLDSRRLLKQVTIKTAQVCRVDRCTIELWEGDRTVPIMSQFADGRNRPDLWAKFMAMRHHTPQEVPAYAVAVQTKKPVVVPDTVASDLIPAKWSEEYEMRACLVIPLIRQDQVVGVMNLDYTDRHRPFEQWQGDLAATIAGQVALALENSRLYAEIRERLKETETLLAVGQVLSQNLPTQEAMRQVAREVGRAFGADMVGAYFLDARKETLSPVAGYHVPKELLSTFLQTPFPASRFPILQEVWRTKKPAWTSDAMNDPRLDPEYLAAIRPGAGLIAPTLVRGEIVGGLILVWWTPGRAFSPAELRLIEGVASQVGLALENADLARQTEEKLRETETLLSVSRTLSSTLDFYPLLRHFLRQVTRILECDSVGVWLVNPASGRLEPVVGYRVPPHLLPAVRKAQIDPEASPFYAEGFRSKRVQVSSNVPEDPRLPAGLASVAPHKAQLFAPIVAKERVIGAFVAVWWDRTREFYERELALIEAMGSQAGVAVENARLFEDNRRRLEELSVLHELSRAVTGQLDLAALVRAIHHQVGRILEAQNMVILLYDETSREIEVALRMREGEEKSTPARYGFGQGLVSRVIERRQPIRTDNYEEECRRQGVKPVEDSLRFPHWLGVPMVAGDQAVGVLVLRSQVHPYSAADERLLANIAGLAALAVRSARLFDERTRAYTELAAAQAQLIRTEKLRALGEMASGVAHDFNNLLASILGRAQLLIRRVEDPKLRKWLQVIERAAMDGARTVRRIQEFARIRRDQPFVPVDLNRVVHDALEVTQARWQEDAQSRGVTIRVKTDLAPLSPVSGDPAELREVLTNLILNAVDAMPEGGTLTLATRADDSAVTLRVSDTGVGIPPDIQPSIFDPFFTTKGPQGTGLGLSITYGIVSRHRGQIRVESDEGQGATFHLTFPLATLDAEPPSPVLVQAVPPLRCLVVDDEQPVLEVLGDVLASGGHSAVLVADGAEAIARFRAEPFDIVFTDLAMPGVSGWQVARAVKDHTPSVPVLLVTGWGVELAAEELLGKGVDAVLSKPVKVEDILAAVATFGSRRRD